MLEKSIPSEYLYFYNRNENFKSIFSPTSKLWDSITIAEAALKVYTIDRAVNYTALKGGEGSDNAANSCPHRLRIQFATRCIVSPRCPKYMCHASKCLYTAESLPASRIPENFDYLSDLINTTVNPSNSNWPSAYTFSSHGPANGNSLIAQQGRGRLPNNNNYYQRGVASGGGEINSSLSMSDYAKRLMEVKREIDIEVTQPYLPSSSELSHVGWI
jgi:hypothetical protein